MDTAAKLKAIRKALGLKQFEMAKGLGLSPQGISRAEQGANEISGRVLELLYLKFNVNPAWWERNEGEMFREQKKSEVPEHLRLLIQTLIDVFPDSASLIERSEAVSKVMQNLREAKDSKH